MDRYNKEMYEIDRPNPSPLFWKARSIAGQHLQNCFNSFIPQNCRDGFFWIKPEPTYPSFDNLTFGYKNQIFSVLIDFVKPVKRVFRKMTLESQLPNRVVNRFLEATQKYNLVPCLFPMHYLELDLIGHDWNLLQANTKSWVTPQKLGTKERIRMSEWEINNFVIQIVRDQLMRDGNKVLSFCDLPEMEPQIWFENSKRERCWVLVKYIVNPEDNDYHRWLGLEKNNKMLQDYDGYFAGVELRNSNDFGTILYRGEGAMPKYMGLKRISLADNPRIFSEK